ncbi:MAG: flagellar hook-associated protein FlgL [bacterium]
MQYTRVTNSYTSDSVIRNLLSNRSKLVDTQTQISSGKRITKISDDVLAGISVVSTNSSLGKINNYIKNIDNAQSELNVTDATLTTLIDSVQQARELTVQASSSTAGSDELQAINAQIKQIIEQVKDLGNTKYGTTYIFGGLQTNTAPFTVPATGEMKYTGSVSGTADRKAEASDGVAIPINVTGDKIFGEYYTSGGTITGSGLLKTLVTLSTELGAANPDQGVIRAKLDEFDSSLQTITNTQAQLGGTSNRLDTIKTALQDDQINLTKIKSGAEDIDMAKTISDLQFQQTALDVSLQVSAKIIQPSLLTYM